MSEESEKIPAPEAAQGDTIAGNRALAIPGASEILAPPPGFRQTPSKARGQLRRLDGDLHSELLQALDQVVSRNLKEDFGRNAPDSSRAAPLAERIRASKKTLLAVELLAAFINEVHNIAINDAVLLLEDVKGLLDVNVSRDPNLSRDYSEVLDLFAARAQKISEGLAAKREEASRAATDDKTVPPK